MKEQEVRQAEIQKLIQQLFSGEEAVYEAAFESLCLYFTDEDIESIGAVLVGRGDTQSLYWWVHYLVWIERPLGFEKLFTLLKSDNPQFRAEACSGILRISANSRIDLLVKMLSLPWKKEVQFAAHYLGETCQPRAFSPLLEALEREQDPKTQVELLKALGKLRDARSLKTLEKWAEHPAEKVQEEALFALSRFAAKMSPKFLARYLASGKPRMKEVAYLAMLRQPGRRWQKLAARHLREEREEEMQASVLSFVRTITERALFDVIFDLALHSSSARIRMMARSALKRGKSSDAFRWLLSEERRVGLEAQEMTLRLLSGFTEERKVPGVLAQDYRKSRRPRIKLAALEGIGRFRRSGLEAFLMSVIKKADLYSLIAASALSRQTAPGDWRQVQEMLNLDPVQYSSVIQTFLNFILRLPQKAVWPPEVEAALEKHLGNSKRQIRYLAARCFARSSRPDKTKILLEVASQDPDAGVRQAALKSLMELMKSDASVIDQMIRLDRGERPLFRVFHHLFSTVLWEAGNFQLILERLMQAVRGLYERYQENKARQSQLLALLRCLVNNHRPYFLAEIHRTRWDDFELSILLHVLNSKGLLRLTEKDGGMLDERYETASAETKKEILKYFALLPFQSPRVERLLFKALKEEGEPEVRAALYEVFEERIHRHQEELAGL